MIVHNTAAIQPTSGLTGAPRSARETVQSNRLRADPIMPEPTYRIKLYGHTSSDGAAFSKNLAMILGIDADEARALLQDVPAVIKQGLPREKAASVVEALALIKALTIMEPEAGAEPGAAAEPIPRADLGTPAVTWEELEEESPWRSWVRPLLAVAVGLVLLVVLSVVLRTPYRGPAVEPVRKPPRPAAAAPASPEQERQEYLQSLTMEQLEGEGERLYIEQQELKQRLKFAQDEVARLYSKYGASEEELSRRRLDLKRVRNELRRNDKEMRFIIQRIWSMERAAARAAARSQQSQPPEAPSQPEPEEAHAAQE